MKKFTSAFKISSNKCARSDLLAGIHVCFSKFFLHLIIHGLKYLYHWAFLGFSQYLTWICSNGQPCDWCFNEIFYVLLSWGFLGYSIMWHSGLLFVHLQISSGVNVCNRSIKLWIVASCLVTRSGWKRTVLGP